jgi:uncharacterized protein
VTAMSDHTSARPSERHGEGAPSSGAAPINPLGFLIYLALGTFLGFVFVLSEVVSWYRIQEMFRFQDPHMYGVIGAAVVVAFLSVTLIRRFSLRAVGGERIVIEPKDPRWRRALFGGSVFGLGWALTGACPGPIAALIGAGLPGYVVVLAGALLGAILYAKARHRLPH